MVAAQSLGPSLLPPTRGCSSRELGAGARAGKQPGHPTAGLKHPGPGREPGASGVPVWLAPPWLLENQLEVFPGTGTSEVNVYELSLIHQRGLQCGTEEHVARACRV